MVDQTTDNRLLFTEYRLLPTDYFLPVPSSLPALAAALAEPEFVWPCQSATQAFLRQPLVPAYRMPIRSRLEIRASRLADAIALLAERLDRPAEA